MLAYTHVATPCHEEKYVNEASLCSIPVSTTSACFSVGEGGFSGGSSDVSCTVMASGESGSLSGE